MPKKSITVGELQKKAATDPRSLTVKELRDIEAIKKIAASKQVETEKPKRKRSKKKAEYSARDEARAFLPDILESLKREVRRGSGIAAFKAADLLVKIADLDSIAQPVDDEIVIVDARPGEQKIIPISKAV